MESGINFKVVKVISPYQVVITGGLDGGLKKGQRVLIYDIGDMILDPDTGEELEALEVIRGTGKIIHIQSKIATVESDMVDKTPKKTIRKSGLGGFHAVFGQTEETEVSNEELPFDEPQVGDRVRPYAP